MPIEEKKVVIGIYVDDILIVGGVSANNRFREKANIFAQKNQVNMIFPNLKYCTDNAAMIAKAGYIKYKHNIFSNLGILPFSSLKNTYNEL